jgi:hypothetical protein
MFAGGVRISNSKSNDARENKVGQNYGHDRKEKDHKGS